MPAPITVTVTTERSMSGGTVAAEIGILFPLLNFRAIVRFIGEVRKVCRQ